MVDFPYTQNILSFHTTIYIQTCVAVDKLFTFHLASVTHAECQINLHKLAN